ncbi:DUF6443 domain-containing protein [Chryseobacterium sp. GP-SGM7]|uniref:DUF6443 domain-containing protein n=1 Tax=Chryseobacterium sp. GP-SGM7 TaxID=3411323 RepID=UPI003B92B2AF
MKKHTLFILLSFVAGLSHAQTATENYIQSTSCLDADCIRKTETIQYFDYLGRPKQIIGVKASPTGKDVVTPIEYDQLGRQVKDYLPIPQSATQNGEIYTSPLSNASAIYGSEKIYAEKVLENSPLERIQQQIHTGNDWANKPVTFGYDANNSADAVKKFATLTTWENGATKTTLAESGIFGDGQLQKNTVTDEDGNITIEFKNGWGQTVLLRKMLGATKADTYYVYNEYDKLAYVIPPLASNAPTLSLSNLDALCYQYRYDGKYNLVEKKIPGKGWEYMVYDRQNRPIMSRDSNLEANGKWLFTKYDKFGRVAYTGIATGGTRSTEQTNADNEVSNTVARTTAVGFTHEINVYYTNTGYPTAINDLLSVNYYDTYPEGSPALPSQLMGQEVMKQPGENGALKNTKSLPLASYLKTIEIGHSWTINYSYYDTKGRAIGSHSINHLGGYTRTETQLDFAGVPQQTKTYHKRSEEDTTERIITQSFEYDAQNRLKKHYHQVDNQPQVLLTENNFNELSQLSNKKVGNNLQSIDYAYNIRGWMTKINDPANLGGKLFGYKVKYQNPVTTPQSSAKYNGNIAEIDWKTANDGVLRRYTYQYDALSRLQNAVYSEPNSSTPSNNLFNETIAYDLNGNITSLQRNGKGASGMAEQIDQLAYAYDNNNLSNRLITVTDTSQNYKGYPDVSGNAITYDANGNMKTHKDKGILNIQYNYLNLPSYMIFDRTYFSRNRWVNENVYSYYRADGVKLRKEHKYSENSMYVKKTTDYLDGFQYEALTDDMFSLKFVPTSEGYFNFENNKYIYNYTDHLGNIRLSYFNNGTGAEVLEENNYYPFGMKHEGYNALAGNPAYGYGYNNKELQKETGWSDYGARMYMPEIGRWGVVDPLAEKTRRWSTYVFSANNSVRFVDPDGRTWGDPKEQDNLNKFVANRISKLQKAIDKIQDQIDKGGLSDNQLSKLTTELTENRKMIGFMEQSIKDIEAIGKAPEVFYLASPSQKDGTHSVFKKIGSNGKEKINIEGTTTAMKLHEIRHVGQSFEAGGMKFNAKGQLLNVPKKINNKLNYNANEVEAYRVGYSYDNTSFPGTVYSLEDINEESLINLSTSSSYIYGTPK